MHRIERKILERAQPREARKVWASKFSCNLSLRAGAAHPHRHADWDAFARPHIQPSISVGLVVTRMLDGGVGLCGCGSLG